MPMKAVIFDLNGTLLASTGMWMQIDNDFLISRGLPVPPGYATTVSAMRLGEAAEYTIAQFGLPDKADDLCCKWFDIALYAYGHTVKRKPHAREYLDALKQRNVKIGVATSSVEELYKAAFKSLDLEGYFDAVATSQEAGRGKAYPDVFLLAAEKLGVSPSDCIVFEDVLLAMKSAKSAGMTVIGIFDEMSKDDWKEINMTAERTLCDFRDAPLPEETEV
jgi:HAD superfamily hydrolase (TIGR01509 family)